MLVAELYPTCCKQLALKVMIVSCVSFPHIWPPILSAHSLKGQDNVNSMLLDRREADRIDTPDLKRCFVAQTGRAASGLTKCVQSIDSVLERVLEMCSVYLYVYMYMYVCVYLCMYVCMHACMHAHTSSQTTQMSALTHSSHEKTAGARHVSHYH